MSVGFFNANIMVLFCLDNILCGLFQVLMILNNWNQNVSGESNTNSTTGNTKDLIGHHLVSVYNTFYAHCRDRKKRAR